MQQIYKTTPLSKCDINRVALQLVEIARRHGVPYKFEKQIFL